MDEQEREHDSPQQELQEDMVTTYPQQSTSHAPEVLKGSASCPNTLWI